MDDFEKRVLRHNRHLLQEHIKIDQYFLEGLRDDKIITNKDMDQIMHEHGNQHRISKLIDTLLKSHKTDIFSQFCSYLAVDFAWLSKDLQSEVEADRGRIEIDDDVNTEAGMLVHKKFGTSKRLSEEDKKDMQYLIALKIQISKEEWKRELDDVTDKLKHQVHHQRDQLKRLHKLDTEALDYIRDHETQLVVPSHGMKTTTDILSDCADDDDVIEITKRRLNFLYRRVTAVLKERDLLREEREKCLQTLGIEDMDTNLHVTIKAHAHKERETIKQEVVTNGDAEKDKTIKSLRKKLAEYEEELDEKDALIDQLKRK